MPPGNPYTNDYHSTVNQIILSVSESDFIDQLIPVLKDAVRGSRNAPLVENLSRYAYECEANIERIGMTKHEEFLGSVNQLQSVRKGTVALTAEILDLNQSIQESTEKLAQQKEALVNTKGIRQNITEVEQALKDSLMIVHAVNNAHDLIRNKNYYAALKSLEDLQNEYLVPLIQNKYATQHKLADIIQRSIPSSQKTISEAAMNDLNTWLYRIRETSQFLGEVAFYHTEMRRERQKNRNESGGRVKPFRLNSALERVLHESDEFDVLDNDEVQVDFTPLYECLHIHDALGQSEKFRLGYTATRRQQKELLLPSAVNLVSDDEESSLSCLLEGIAGFAIIEKASMARAPQLRSSIEVDELWDSMCHQAIAVISKALSDVPNVEVLLKVKGVFTLFIQTMESWGYSVSMLDTFLLTLFHKYTELLQKRFSEDFQEIVSTDDYMPMSINTPEEYEKVLSVSWFMEDPNFKDISFPYVLPFSQMYPLCCIDIRNFLNQFYFFSDDHFQHPDLLDETLRSALDQLLTEKVCHSLVERLNSPYLGQIVQILTNLEHFENACEQLEQMLIKARSSSTAGGPVALRATEEFKTHKKTAEKRIFEFVNAKIDDLIDTAEYDWMAPDPPTETSNYMQTLTRYLSSIMGSQLLGLPREIRELVYFDALSHAANKILALPLNPEVKKINRDGVAGLAKDVEFLSQFVSKLENAFMLEQTLDELKQTIELMQSDNHDEFYDISARNKKYGRVDAINGPVLLEKLTQATDSIRFSPAPLTNFSSRFGLK